MKDLEDPECGTALTLELWPENTPKDLSYLNTQTPETMKALSPLLQEFLLLQNP